MLQEAHLRRCPVGRLVAFECRRGRQGHQAQRAVHEALRAAGVAVHVVRTVSEARDALTGFRTRVAAAS
jgi:hypothetical protein